MISLSAPATCRAEIIPAWHGPASSRRSERRRKGVQTMPRISNGGCSSGRQSAHYSGGREVLSADFADDADEEKICAICVICGCPCRVALSAIRNSQFEIVRASFPVFILGWTIGAFGVWPSRSDAMTIARHFNAGLNPQNIPSPGGTTEICRMKCGTWRELVTFVQPSLRDLCRCRRIPGVETPGYCRVVPLGRTRADGSRSANGTLDRMTGWSG